MSEPNRPPWLDETAVKYIVGIENGATVVRYPGGDHAVKWRSDCQTCCHYSESAMAFFPAHDAMRGCRSGRRRPLHLRRVLLMVIPEPIPDPQNCRHPELVAIGETEDGMCTSCGAVMSFNAWDGER